MNPIDCFNVQVLLCQLAAWYATVFDQQHLRPASVRWSSGQEQVVLDRRFGLELGPFPN
jgi:hypothetical protein